MTSHSDLQALSPATARKVTVGPAAADPARFHVIIDVLCCPQMRVSETSLHRLLFDLPGLIGMRVLAGPFVVAGVDANPGFTGFVIIDFSHIAIHSFNRHDSVMIDIFSCVAFDVTVACHHVAEALAIPAALARPKVVSWGGIE
jgi:S-adenosylmethionine/arginine decarboxylase-like enzyme